MKIIYLGSGAFGIHCLNALANSSHSLELIVTAKPHPAGRGRKLNPTPVAQWVAGQASKIAVIETDNANSPEIMEKIAAYQVDLIVVAAFGQKISNELINLPPKGSINVHASLLPKYRGAAPINWAIINGEKQTGISIVTVAEKIDAGQVLAQKETDIGDDETAGQLHDRLAAIAAPLLMETIDKIADGSAVYTQQDEAGATMASKLKKTDGFLDFSESADSLKRKILGFWPWPGASANYVSKKTGKCIQVTIAGASVAGTSDTPGLQPGLLDENLNVVCGKGSLVIKKIKPAGGRVMDFEDFVNGRKICPGDSFMKIDR